MNSDGIVNWTSRVPLTPRHTRGSSSKAYWELGLMAERRFGNVLENLLNVSQNKYDPFVLPRAPPDGRWTVDAASITSRKGGGA